VEFGVSDNLSADANNAADVFIGIKSGFNG
jgi:hypothetical protein